MQNAPVRGSQWAVKFLTLFTANCQFLSFTVNRFLISFHFLEKLKINFHCRKHI